MATIDSGVVFADVVNVSISAEQQWLDQCGQEERVEVLNVDEYSRLESLTVRVLLRD